MREGGLSVKERTAQAAKAEALHLLTLTAPARMLPSYLVVGTKRGGSSSLHNYVNAHPDVVPALVTKGTHYFDTEFSQGWGWYRSRFPFRLPGRRAAISGESSPYYMFHPLAPGRIARALPTVKLIAVLRNPSERAWSQWCYETHRGNERLPFEAALDAEADRLEGEHERLVNEANYRSLAHRRFSYVARGRYAEQLDRLRELFPPSQILVVQSEALFAQPTETMQHVYRFLGLPAWESAQYPVIKAVPHGNMPDSARERLDDYFSPWNERLYRDDAVGFRW